MKYVIAGVIVVFVAVLVLHGRKGGDRPKKDRESPAAASPRQAPK